MNRNNIRFGYTFDDLILVPRGSSVLPNQVDVRTRLSRNLSLNIPIVSAAMDTVTESDTAITVARQGGFGYRGRDKGGFRLRGPTGHRSDVISDGIFQ